MKICPTAWIQRRSAAPACQYLNEEQWQLSEIRAAVDELDAGQGISHDKVRTMAEVLGQNQREERPEVNTAGRQFIT
jgi:predicted transcriptional regulator